MKNLLLAVIISWAAYIIPAHAVEEGQQPCPVSLPQNTPSTCLPSRKQNLEEQRMIYKLGSRMDLPMPLVNLSMAEMIRQKLSEPFDSLHAQLYMTTVKRHRVLAEQWVKEHPEEITEYFGYEKIVNFFKKDIKSNKEFEKYYRLPSDYELFKDVFDDWNNDDVFADLRLAGCNPFAIRKVTKKIAAGGMPWRELVTTLNKGFDWESAVQHAIDDKLSLNSAIAKDLVYVVRYEIYDDMSAVPDSMDPRPTRHMLGPSSPIGLFGVRLPKGKDEKPKLIPVAIQMDYKPEAEVYTPQDGDMWTWAKLSLSLADFFQSQIDIHLTKVHLLAEPLCASLRRHLSERHPLYQSLKYHCRGLLTANALGAPALLEKGQYTDKLFSVGQPGTLEMLHRSYKQLTWDESDFTKDIRDRGLGNKKRLPYFPYRDDSELVLVALNRMVQDYIDLYYTDDADVRNDVELQAYFNELSIDGKGPGGGQGNIKNFPAKVNSKKLLVNTITRFLWLLCVKHTAVDFPVADYAAFSPVMSTKLYYDDRVQKGSFSIFNLPSGNISAVQVAVAMNIGIFRYDRLFDYGDELEDELAGVIVKAHRGYLHGVVDALIMERNKQRYQAGHLTYPYFLSRWLPNGIQV